MNSLEYVYIPGFRANSKLLLVPSEKQVYKFKANIQSDKKFYICYQKECRVGIVVENNSVNLCRRSGNNTEHRHSCQEDLIEKLKLLNEIKTNCKNANIKRNSTRDIFNETCKNFKNNEIAGAINFGKMRRNLINIKNKEFPKNPSNILELIEIFKSEKVVAEFGISRYDNKSTFYKGHVVEEDFSYMVFMSPTICELIKQMPNTEPRHYLLDGTFAVVPASCGFKQLLIVHIGHNEHTYPFIYILMTKRTVEAYVHAFKYIKSNLFDLKPSSFMTDFEMALRNSLIEVYPQTNMKGCWFHYTQAIRRFVACKVPTLLKMLRKNKELMRIYKKFLVLPLMKLNDLLESFELIKKEIENQDDVTKTAFSPFLKYFERQWIRKEGSTISLSGAPMRTTSSLEGFNSLLCSKLSKNGNFFKFLDFILDTDFTKTTEFKNSLDGTYGIFEAPKRKFKRRDESIEGELKKLSSGKITHNDFLNIMTNVNNCFATEEAPDQYYYDNETYDDSEELPEDTNVDHSEANLCIICCEKERVILLLPCKHFKLCVDCFDKLSSNYLKKATSVLCPVCRQIVTNTMSIFS